MPPIIAISSTRAASARFLYHVQIPEKYAAAILQAGGLPVVLPLGYTFEQLSQMVGSLDGILLSGGGDIHPDRFHGIAHEKVADIVEQRDVQEDWLVKLSLEQQVPLLGICRGLQVMNVSLGGTLYTHIPDQFETEVEHATPKELPRDHPQHTVKLEPETKIHAALNLDEFPVNSHHHQAIHSLAPGLRITGRASDGLIEAIELPEEPFFLGVQWHPEWMTQHDHARDLFRAFVVAAEKYKESKVHGTNR